MTLKGKARGMIGAVSRHALEDVRAEAQRLFQDARQASADEAMALRTELEALREEARAGRREIEELRDAVDVIRGRLQEQASVGEARAEELVQLKQRVEEGSEGAEALRLKVAALAEQLRWDSDALRKAVSAMAVRVEGRAGAA